MSKKKKRYGKKHYDKNYTHSDDEYEVIEQDDDFYFIAGYTPGGVPFGVSWDEAEDDGLIDPETGEEIKEVVKHKDLPF